MGHGAIHLWLVSYSYVEDVMSKHDTFHGRKVRIPNPRPGWINPFAGKLGDVTYAGWDDWYYVHVDGVYMVRAQAHELEPNLVEDK